MSSAAPLKNHLLTILVEDYFHVGAFEKLIRQRQWSNFEPRYKNNTLKTLDLLDKFETKGTFFILGWIAEHDPAFIREIVNRGHEVASRGYYHRSLRSITREQFIADIRRTNRVLEDATGERVSGFRSAEKLYFGRDEWVFDVLVEEGFDYDASFVPTKRVSNEHRFVKCVQTAGGSIWEFPYSTRDLGLGLFPISGGNYFRQIPYTLMRRAVTGWDKSFDDPFVLYFHVWELDPEQPRISSASHYNRIRHYRKLDKMEWVIKENLERYSFTSISGYLGLDPQPGRIRSAEPELAAESGFVPGVGTTEMTPVTIVIPCYNEQDAIPYLANILRSVESLLRDRGYAAEFIFVDDQSSDGTFNALTEIASERANIRVIRHETNKGVAGGIMTGIRAARTEIVCSMDCDCTYDPHELADMLPLLDDDVDMVTASPYHKLGEVRNVPAWRLTLSRGASMLYRQVLRSKMRTYTSCFRVYRRRSLESIELDETGFLGVTEMLAKVDLADGKIIEYPTILDVRLFGASKMRTARAVLGHLRLLAGLVKARIRSERVKKFGGNTRGSL